MVTSEVVSVSVAALEPEPGAASLGGVVGPPDDVVRVLAGLPTIAVVGPEAADGTGLLGTGLKVVARRLRHSVRTTAKPGH